MTTTIPTAPRARNGTRIAAFIASGVLGLFAAALLAGGGLSLWGDAQKDEQGYISTDSERFATSTRALATENLDLDLDGLDELVGRESYGKLRLEVAADDGKPAFVGVARTDDVSRYLRGTAHTVLTDVDYSPFHADYSERAGSRPPGPPAAERFWAASAQGTGAQTLTWDVADGDWTVVVMNADGSSGVDARVRAGAELPFLDEAGWILIGTGLLALVGAGALLYTGIAARRRYPSA